MDTDHSGTISFAELREGLRSRGAHLADRWGMDEAPEIVWGTVALPHRVCSRQAVVPCHRRHELLQLPTRLACSVTAGLCARQVFHFVALRIHTHKQHCSSTAVHQSARTPVSAMRSAQARSCEGRHLLLCASRCSELQRIMTECDLDGNSTLDFQEFLTATCWLGKLERREHLLVR